MKQHVGSKVWFGISFFKQPQQVRYVSILIMKMEVTFAE